MFRYLKLQYLNFGLTSQGQRMCNMTCILIKQGDLCCAASFVVMCCPDNDVTMGS